MSSDIAIKIENLRKCYHVYERPRDRLLQLFFRRHRRYYREFWALKDISFEVKKGETVGIVGRNGSGKSTLLQIICGILVPTDGKVETQGRIAALLELGSGFNPEFTGRENIYMNAAILGICRQEIEERFDSILAFADIGEFIDQPVKNYSSGMALRLAFAVQAQIDPDILIVDEALAVGDARFQAKCFERLRQLKENGTSILLVTHSGEQIVTHCSRAVLLESGCLREVGEPRKVMNHYMDILFGREKMEPFPLPLQAEDFTPSPASSRLNYSEDVYSSHPLYNPHEYRWGDGAATIMDFYIAANGQEILNSVPSGAKITLEVAIRFNLQVINPILGFNLKTKEGITLCGSNSALLDCEELRSTGKAGSIVIAFLSFENRLTSGDYFISIGIASRHGEEIIPHDRRYDSIHLVVSQTESVMGLVDLGLDMEITEVALQ
jgi:lipopolysaccharide transport system ATP-binding protein